jgi:shikimate dehydrogenase
MGWPVGHSRSPLIHKHWIAEHRLQGDYVLLPVQPTQLETALRALPVLGFVGCNLTIPHKVAALGLVDEVEPLAQRIGAINTIIVQENGSLLGRNTDAFGFMQSLRDAQPGWVPAAGPAVVLGAGGAARAVIAGLLDSGVPSIRLCNRSTDKAQELVDVFGPKLSVLPWADRHGALPGANLLVNTTNLGMQGQPALELELGQLSPQALVSDVIYAPLETPLLAMARQRGHATVNGLGMLLHQARPAFAAWFGVMPDVSASLLDTVHASF